MTAQPPRMPEHLRKRDGQVVPFDARRIMAAVSRAQDAVGDADPGLPVEVAELVVLTLVGRAEADRVGMVAESRRVPSLEEVQDLVEEALVGLGRTRVARAYILYRDRRSRARATLSVSEAGIRGKQAPQVRGEAGVSPWNRSRIAAALVRESGLGGQVAEEVARRVERQVLALGATRVSSGLVRAFVDQELEGLGLYDAARATEPVGIPRPDLRALLRAPRDDRRSTEARHGTPNGSGERRVGASIMARWARQDWMDEEFVRAHQAGEVLALGLERFHLPLVRSVSASGLGDGGVARALGPLTTLLDATAHGVVLEGICDLLGPPRRARETDRAVEVLVALGALARASGRRLDLANPGGRGPRPIVQLLSALVHGLAGGLAMPKLFLEHAAAAEALEAEPALAEGLEELLAAGQVIPVWSAPGESFAGPGLARRARERGPLTLGAAVAVDLVRLARRAGPWNEEAFLSSLVERAESAVDAVAQLAAAQEDLSPGIPVGRRLHALVPVGLGDVLRILGDGVARPDQGARVLGVLRDAAQQAAERAGLVIELSTLLSGPASSVLARRAAGEARPTQAGLFGEGPLPESERVERYLSGFDLGAAQSSWEPRDRGASLAALAATLPTGALWPLHDPLTSQRAGLACLSTWSAFVAARAELLEPRVLRPTAAVPLADGPPRPAEAGLPFEQPARPRA